MVENVERVLPLLLEACARPSTASSLQGAVELIGGRVQRQAAARVPSLVAPLRVALNIRERSVVVGAPSCSRVPHVPRSPAAAAPHHAQLLPPMAAFALKGQPTLGDSVEYSRHAASTSPTS